MAVAGFVLSFLGIFLAFASILMAYVAFFAPTITAKFALKSSYKWLEIPSHKDGVRFLRHELLSGFSIEIDFSNPVAKDFFEPWLKSLYRPDKNASSYYVVISFNGLPIMNELFISYDGSRNFIPAPKIKKVGGRSYLYFDTIQRNLAYIVGCSHLFSIDEIMDKILKSRYNPIPPALDVANEKLNITDLDNRIRKFKEKSSFF